MPNSGERSRKARTVCGTMLLGCRLRWQLGLYAVLKQEIRSAWECLVRKLAQLGAAGYPRFAAQCRAWKEWARCQSIAPARMQGRLSEGMLTHRATRKIISTHPAWADEGNLAGREIHTGNLWDVFNGVYSMSFN